MSDIANCSPAVRKIIADPESFSEAVEGMVTLHRKELELALIDMLGNPYVGVLRLTNLLMDEFQVILIEKEATDILGSY